MKRRTFHRVRTTLATTLVGVGIFCISSPALALCCKCHLKDTPTQNLCLTDTVLTDCADILTKNSSNKDLSGVTCETTPDAKLDTTTTCRTVANSGICQAGPTAALDYKIISATTASSTAGTGSGKPIVIDAPTLGVPIPGLQFTKNITVIPGEEASIPFFAQYLSAVYSYLLGISVITAAVMIVYGGFKYVLSATISGVQSGKDKINDALVGLVVVFTGYTILQTINPNLVVPASLKFKTVKTQDAATVPYDAVQKIMGTTGDVNWNSADCDNIEVDPKTKFPTVASAYDCAIKMAKASNIDPCYAVVKLNWESGGQTLLGCDENVTQPGVGSRVDFVKSGITYTGVKLTTSGDVTKDVLDPKLVNDDACSKNRAVDASKPDYGIDWRFSLGIGLGQVTLMPGYTYCDTSSSITTNNPNPNNKGKGPSAEFGGHCYTLKELLLPGPNLKASFYILKTQSRGKAEQGPDFDSARAAWYGYGGSGPWANRVSFARATDTAACAKGIAAGQKITDFIGSNKKSALPDDQKPFPSGKMDPW